MEKYFNNQPPHLLTQLKGSYLLALTQTQHLFSMYYIYLIQNKVNKAIYYGYTDNLCRRLREYNKDGDWELICYEAYRSEEDARKRERKLKDYGQSRTHLKRRLSKSLLK